MPFFQSVQVKMSSGQAGSTMQTVERVQSASYNFTVPRADVGQLGRFKMLNNRPVINYTPVSYAFDAVKSSKEIELNLGLINSTGVGIIIGRTNGSSVADYGARNFEFLNSQASNSTYDSKYTLLSGCLNSYSVSASIGEPAKVSFNGEAFEVRTEQYSATKDNLSYATAIVRPQDVITSGIQLSGIGITGLNIQSFSLNLSISRQAIGYFGRKFPDRPISSMSAVLSMNGFLEGVSPLSGISSLDCGEAMTGSIFLTLTPSCSGGGLATTYQCKNPYLDSFNLGASIGSYTSVDLSFSIPISINESEANDGSNLIIL